MKHLFSPRSGATLALAAAVASQAIGQGFPGIDPQNIMVTDQYGNQELLSNISVPGGIERGGGNACVAGFFRLVFTDQPGTGFNDPAWSTQLQEAACRAFTDLSQLIIPAADPYTGAQTVPLVNMEISSTGLAAGEVGRGASWLSLVTQYTTDGPQMNGIMDAQVWRTINGGYDAWRAEEIIINNPFQPTYFHGYVRINLPGFLPLPTWWHIDGTAPPVAPPFDLYTIITHEAMHALGFLSYVSEFGSSEIFGQFYSRFDTHVNAQGIPVLTNPWSCDALGTNPGDLTAPCITPPGPVTFNGSNAGTLSLYSPDPWNFNGGSLDHLDITCSGGLNYLMAPGNIPGQIQNRTPIQDEANVLCDIDYHTTTNYGTSPLWVGTITTTLDECGHRIAGVDDIFYFNTDQFYICPENGSIVVTDFLQNDEDELSASGTPQDYDCPTVIWPWAPNTGTVTYVNNTTLEYIPPTDYVGLAIIRYRPIFVADGRKGSLTYVYIKIEPQDACAAQECNIVNGGDFESLTMDFTDFFNAATPYSDLQLPTNDPQYENNNSPDPTGWNGSAWTHVQYASSGIWCEPFVSAPIPASHNGLPNEMFIGLASNRDGQGTVTNHESIMLKLCRELQPGQDYVLSLWATDPCGHDPELEFFFFPERPCVPTIATTDVTGGTNTCGGVSFTNQLSLTQQLSGSVWVNYLIPFTYPAGAVPSDWLVTSIGAPPAAGTWRYVLLDDVVIRPVISVTGTVTPACIGTASGEITIDVGYTPGSYTILWSTGESTATISGLAEGTYTVTITDTDLGCDPVIQEFVVPEQPCDPFTITKTVNTNNTYAGAPVLFTFVVCNYTATLQNVTLTDAGLFDTGTLDQWFFATSSAPTWANFPFDPLTLPVPANECVTVEVAGHFVEMGTYINCVEAVPPLPEVPVSDCTDEINVWQNCPLAVSGTGDCFEDGTVQMCMSVHSLITNVGVVDFDWVYPNFLTPPDQAQLLGALSQSYPIVHPFNLAACTIGTPATYDADNNVVSIHIEYAPGISTAGLTRLFCITFDITAAPTAGENIFTTFVIGQGGVLNRTDLYEPDGITEIHPGAGFWTQAANIILTGCPDMPMGPEAEFTVEVPACGGAVHVEGVHTDGAIHMWTWGDDRTTPMNGAQDYTYDYFAEITENTGWNFNGTIPGAPPGTYTITHTVILNGVASTSQQTITLYACCAAAVAIEDGTTSSSMGYGYSMTTLDIRGQFIVDNTFVLDNCTVYMEPGAEIIITGGNLLDVSDCSFSACRDMWRSITVEDGGAVYLRRSTLADGQYAVKALDGSLVVAYDNYFHRDYTGIHVPDGNSWNNVIFNVHGNEFATAGPLTTPYPGQTPALGTMSFAGIDVHDMALDLTDGGGTVLPNRFIGLSNGVSAERSDVRMNNCVFQDIQPDAAYGTVNDPNGAAVYAYDPNGRGFYSLRQEGFGMGGTNSFKDCRWGIYTEYMSVRSESNNMLNVGTAYHIERSSYRAIDILNNTLDTRFDGIQLYMNDGCAHMLVLNNQITFATNPPPGQFTKGYTAINVKEANTANPSSVIQGNTIWYRTGASTARAGIAINSANDYLVANNSLHMYSNAYNYAGIILSGSRRPVVSCNNVLGSFNNYGIDDGQSAIRNNLGGQGQIFCNDMDGTVNGLYFSGAAAGTDLSGNNIRNHKWGLHLDNNAVIDQQYWKGNLWYNSPVGGGLGAWYENALNASVFKFKYDPTMVSGGNPEPPTWTPIDWFNLDPGVNYLCDDGAVNYCAQFYHDRCEDCKTELDERTAEGELQNNPYTDETRWMMEGDLYTKLDNAPQMMDDDQALADFYDGLQNSVTAQFKSINDEYLDLFDLDATIRTYLANNRAQIEALMAQVKAAVALLEDEGLTATQRAAIVANIEGLNGNISNLIDLNNQALELAANTKNLSADAVKATNAQVGASELIETNEKQVNTIYLSTVAKEIDAFTATEVSQIFDVANQCPMLGGNAVYRARSLYALIDDEAEFDDPALCLQHGIIMRSAEAPKNVSIAVVPNPASDEATLIYELAENTTGQLILYDALGKEVARHALGADMRRYYFSTASLARGAYHYRVLEEDGVLGEGKLTIVR